MSTYSQPRLGYIDATLGSTPLFLDLAHTNRGKVFNGLARRPTGTDAGATFAYFWISNATALGGSCLLENDVICRTDRSIAGRQQGGS